MVSSLAAYSADSDNREPRGNDDIRSGHSWSGSFLLGWDVRYHLVWGTLTFIVLIAATVLARRDFGVDSTLFKVGLAAIVDFVIQGILGLFSFGSGVAVVVHLTNAFLLAVIVTYLISFADSADKASTTIAMQTKTAPSGNMPA